MATYTLAEAKLRTSFEVGDIISVGYTGEPQNITMPDTISRVKLECHGAGGGPSNASTNTEKGGYSVGEYFMQYKTLNLYVGGKGIRSTDNNGGGWNGGGRGYGTYSGGGGGATDVRVDGITPSNRIIVAGGASGTSSLLNPGVAWYYLDGKQGGGTSGDYLGGMPSEIGANGRYTSVGYYYYTSGGGGGYNGGKDVTQGSSYGGTGYVGGVVNGVTTTGQGSIEHGSILITILEITLATPVVSNYLPTSNTTVNPFVSNNFTFTYTETEEAEALEQYNVYYKLVTDPTWTSTGWINNTTASGGTVTHIFSANTFTADKEYEWYAICKTQGVESEIPTTKATFTTLLRPLASTIEPKNSIKVNALTSTRLKWTYTDPLGSAQSAYEVFYKKAGGTEVSTGKITSANAYHDISAKGLDYANDPVYEWRVVVWNTEDIVSVSSDTASFIYLLPYEPSGTYTSKTLSVPRGLEVPPITVSYSATTPTGTTVTVKIRTSVDNITWSAWETLTTNSLDLSGNFAYLQYEVITTTTELFVTPAFTGFTITYYDQYLAEGTWESPVFDLSYMNIDEHSLTTTEDVTYGTATYYTRYRQDSLSTWSSWEPAFTTTGYQMQLKAVLTPSADELNTPILTSIIAEFTPLSKRSVWFSQAVNVSEVEDLTQSVLKANLSLLPGGQIILYSRSKNSLHGEWSAWNLSLEDGTLTHPPDNFIQIIALINGDGEVKELTLNLDDADSGVVVIKTGLAPKAEYAFTTLNNKAIIVNGNDGAMMWDGVDEPEPLGTNPPVLSMVLTHHNKAWGVDREVASRVRYSNILDPTEWDAFDFIDFNPDDGDYITAILRYGQNLIVSKLRSMALLTGNRGSNYSVSWLDSEAGASGKNAMCVADKYVVYVSQDGVRFTDLAQSVIATERLLPSWETISKRRLNQAAIVYWKNRLYVSLPTEASLYNNTVWVYDFLRNSWSIIEGWEVSRWQVFNQYGEEMLLAGSSETGQLYVVDVTEYDDVVPVEFEWRSKDFHFNHPEKYKLFRNIFMDIEGVAETTQLEVDLIVDGEITGTYQTTIPAGAGVKTTRRILPPLYGAVLGSNISIQVRGRCGIHGITIEYAVRGNIPGGDY